MAKQITVEKAIRVFPGIVFLFLFANAGLAHGQVTCAYVNDNFSTANSVEGYMVSAGAPVHVGPVATGGSGSPAGDGTFYGTPLIAIAPGTAHLYASDSGSGDIALFDIDSSNCQLVFVADYSSRGTSAFGLGITISRDGKFLYASDGARQSKLVVFPINSDGSLANPVQIVNLPAVASTLAIAPNGKVLIVTQSPEGRQVESYTINPTTGKVTFAASVATVAAADGVAIDPQSHFVYVGDGGEGGAAAVQVVEIGPDASLTYVANIVFNGFDNPAGIPGGSNCLLMSPNGQLLFFSDQLDALMVSLAVDSQTGGLTVLSTVGDGISFVDEPSQIAATASPALLFTGDFNSDGNPNMGVLQVSSGGTLQLLGRFPLAPQAAATSIAAAEF